MLLWDHLTMDTIFSIYSELSGMNYCAVNSHTNVNHRRVLYGKLAVVLNLHLDTFMHQRMSRLVLLTVVMFYLSKNYQRKSRKKDFF